MSWAKLSNGEGETRYDDVDTGDSARGRCRGEPRATPDREVAADVPT
jgi:hypothetical protein